MSTILPSETMHSFVIPAYRVSQHLETCLQSLLAQELQSKIVITTSTPNEHIQQLADRYNVPLFVRIGTPNIADDWNFALSCATTPLVTLAHQDDVYASNFVNKITHAFVQHPYSCLSFSNYTELRNHGLESKNKLLSIKQILILTALLGGNPIQSSFFKRNLLRFGNAVCCPSVTLNFNLIPDFRFNANLRVALDWQAWLDLTRTPFAFIFHPENLVQHRIHAQSETSAAIANQLRDVEDLVMFKQIWPAPIAKILARLYSKAYQYNN